MDQQDWKRVSKRRPCPVCGKFDWCTFVGPGDNPEAALCPRTPEGSQGWKGADGGGYLHVLRERDDTPPAPRPKPRPAPEPSVDVGSIAKRAASSVTPPQLAAFADSLGLSVEALSRLRCGWSEAHDAWTFPMVDAFGRVRGIRLRAPDGRKWAVRGGREGLFVPSSLDAHHLLVICEGPSDCAALLDMGVDAVGRPSCTGGSKHLRWLVSLRRPREVAILHDRDEPGSSAERATTAGAERLADLLASAQRTIRIIQPPEGLKDARQWRQSGASQDDLMAVIDAAQPRRLARGAWMKRVTQTTGAAT